MLKIYPTMVLFRPFDAVKLASYILLVIGAYSAQAQQVISLEQAIRLAQQNDPWLAANKLKQRAMEHRSIAAGSLPDPSVSLTVANLPADSWRINQEAMTQLKLGVSQKFPRGDSLAIKARQLEIASGKFPLLKAERQLQVKATVSELWFDAYLAQQTIQLIESDRALFEQMAEIVKANYASVVGKTRQQDVILAQLELVKLQDRLTVEQQKLETTIARLNQWLIHYESAPLSFSVSNELPDIRLNRGELIKPSRYDRDHLVKVLLAHPTIQAMDVKQRVSEKSVSLAKQQYQPQWAVNASYAYRDDMASGEQRADLFSLGVTFDLPLFTDNKQDQHVAASIAESQAVKTEKLLLVKQMLSKLEKEIKQLQRLSERQQLYKQQILRQSHEQAEASLTAYTNDDGDFAEVVRARIAELNARISALQIDVSAIKTVVRLNYFLIPHDMANSTVHQQLSGVK